MTTPPAPLRVGYDYRIERLEQTLILLARHVGTTSSKEPLHSLLTAIEADLRQLAISLDGE